jgi:hypothetical protein
MARPDPDPSEWPRKTADGVIDYRFCQGCGRRLSKVAIGLVSRKLHCSSACRHRAWRKRHGHPVYEGPGSPNYDQRSFPRAARKSE